MSPLSCQHAVRSTSPDGACILPRSWTTGQEQQLGNFGVIDDSMGGAAGSPVGPVRNRSRHTRLLVVLLLPVAVLTQAIWTEDGVFRESLEWLGYTAVIVCVLGRIWSTAYIAGRKSRELVDSGPYSVVRNPLYGFSFIGLAGIGLLTGSIVWATLLLAGCALYFSFVVRREESFLTAAFPADYPRYLETTPRWWPDPRLWQDVTEVTIRPALVKRALLDGACFLIAIPLFEALAEAHDAGLLPALLSLP
jgi:protein-S-isoprenylcysteine O-methyltransferase Ste14